MKVRVGKAEEFAEGTVRSVTISPDLQIAVFRVQGRFYALEDRCSHEDARLSEGEVVEGCCVKCPRHGAKFDLATGRALTLPAVLPVRTFPIHIKNGDLLVEI